MARYTYISDSDQYDPKVFKETFGSFGTTTKPGSNQLTELQTKAKQGVKHVELALWSKGKGQFGQQDVPDKYGLEQRRTIMQLAKLNQQNLSVHATVDVTDFSGLTQRGFDESQRYNEIKEIDESLKFAAETAKGGAVVFHMQGAPMNTSRNEINISKSYLNWLKKYKPDEYERINKEYFNSNPLSRIFVDNPEEEKEVRKEFNQLKNTQPQVYQKYVDKANEEGREPWEVYSKDKYVEKVKYSPDDQPIVVVGDKTEQVQRTQEMVDVETLVNKDILNDKEKNLLNNVIDLNKDKLTSEEVQKVNAIFTNGLPKDLENQVTQKELDDLKKKVLVNYEKFLEKNNFMRSQADEEFQKKLIDNQIKMAQIQKNELDNLKNMYSNELEELEKVNKKIEDLSNKLTQVQDEEEKEKLKNELVSEKSKKVQLQQGYIGLQESQQLEKYHEQVAQLNKKINELEEQKQNVKSISDKVFDSNITAMGHLGMKALKYQIDLKKKAEKADEKVSSLNSQLNELEKQFENASSPQEKDKVSNEIAKTKRELKNWQGLRDYKDIDLKKKPLYLSPENMLPGMGNITSLEEFKGAIRMSQEDFADKILSDEEDYKELRKEYEKEIGEKIDSREKAKEVAKKHLAGTLDSAHAGAWLKHFKKLPGESDEHKIERFNKWLNEEAEKMYEEGIVRHVHLNDTLAKDDDHNLIGQGILDLHDMRERLRKKGFDESLIVEAGGRGPDKLMHLTSAFEFFNPAMSDVNAQGYRPSMGEFAGKNVSDWIEVNRVYNDRPQYSPYGLSQSTFKHQPSENQPRGNWSGTGFL